MNRKRMSQPDLVTTGFCIVGGAAVVVLVVICGVWARRAPAQRRLSDAEFERRFPRLWERMRRGGVKRRGEG